MLSFPHVSSEFPMITQADDVKKGTTNIFFFSGTLLIKGTDKQYFEPLYICSKNENLGGNRNTITKLVLHKVCGHCGF